MPSRYPYIQLNYLWQRTIMHLWLLQSNSVIDLQTIGCTFLSGVTTTAAGINVVVKCLWNCSIECVLHYFCFLIKKACFWMCQSSHSFLFHAFNDPSGARQNEWRVCSTLERKTREIAEDSVDTATALTPFNLVKNRNCIFQWWKWHENRTGGRSAFYQTGYCKSAKGHYHPVYQ